MNGLSFEEVYGPDGQAELVGRGDSPLRAFAAAEEDAERIVAAIPRLELTFEESKISYREGGFFAVVQYRVGDGRKSRAMAAYLDATDLDVDAPFSPQPVFSRFAFAYEFSGVPDFTGAVTFRNSGTSPSQALERVDADADRFLRRTHA